MHQHSISGLLRAAALTGLVALVAWHGRAEAHDGTPISTIRATGEATVMARPDRVEIDVGVVTRAQTAQTAAAENARLTTNVIAALRKALGPKATIETVSYALYPDYQYPPQGGEPKLTGFTATNLVRVTQDDLTNVGTVLDQATRAGANRIDRIRFTLKDPGAATAQALRAAALDARSKVSTLALALGQQIARVSSVEESSGPTRPIFDLAVARNASSTPILPGSIEVRASVTLAVELVRR